MPESVPIEAAQQVADAHGLSQVILLGWDGVRVHVVTYGTTVADSMVAAEGGNRIKESFSWPTELCEAMSAKERELRDRIAELEKPANAPSPRARGHVTSTRTVWCTKCDNMHEAPVYASLVTAERAWMGFGWCKFAGLWHCPTCSANYQHAHFQSADDSQP